MLNSHFYFRIAVGKPADYDSFPDFSSATSFGTNAACAPALRGARRARRRVLGLRWRSAPRSGAGVEAKTETRELDRVLSKQV